MMRTMSRLVAALPVWLLAGAAWAQGNVPDPPTLNRSAPVWLGFLIMFVLVAVVMAVSLMPSKRSHQD